MKASLLWLKWVGAQSQDPQHPPSHPALGSPAPQQPEAPPPRAESLQL